MTAPRILIVDDEPNIRFVLERALQYEGYDLDSAATGAEALQKLAGANPPYDLLLLDLQMEPVDGLQVLQVAKEQDPDLAVIILTAHGSLDSAIEALRLAAFDYLLKPAAPETVRRQVRQGLQQRLQALRRHQLMGQVETFRQVLAEMDDDDSVPPSQSAHARFIRSGSMVIDKHQRQAILDDEPLDLTTAEFDLLLCLIGVAPTPLSPRDLVNCALGYDCEDQEARNTIRWHIHRLRHKLEPDPAHPTYIKTVRHKGYLWSSGETQNL